MKRIFDILVSVTLLVVLSPLIVFVALVILWTDGRPVFYVSERMNGPQTPFWLYKFRSMRNVAEDEFNAGVSGGDKDDRITPIGAKLRKYRLDELPQLINVVRGDMSLVGPRPPLRQYTDAFPDLYGQVLQCRPGITGLASLHFHRHEERLLRGARSPEETEAIYTSRCIPRKATLDLIYARHASVCFDLVILWRTAKKVFGRA